MVHWITHTKFYYTFITITYKAVCYNASICICRLIKLGAEFNEMLKPVVVLRSSRALVAFALAIVLCYMCYIKNDIAQIVKPVLPSQMGIGNLFSKDTHYKYLTNNSNHNSDQPQLIKAPHPTIQARAIVNNADINNQQSQGHILLYSSKEEQTNGAKNLWQLQMWAEILKMNVVEPFAVESMFGMFGALPNFSQALRFSDYFDIEKWNKLAHDHGGGSLVQWEDFLSNTPRKAIVLYTLTRNLKESFLVTYGSDDIYKYNPGKNEHIPNEDMMWLKQNFNITRVVTFIRYEAARHPFSLEELKSYVFGDLDPNEVTLIVVNWIGISTLHQRIQVKQTADHNNYTRSLIDAMLVDFHLPQSASKLSPSWRVLKAYKNFVSKNIGSQKYIGIIFRTHCVLKFQKGDFIQKSQHLLTCSKQLKHTLDKVRNKWGIFMAYDLGTFGSDGYYSTGDQQLLPLRDQIFSDVFNGSISIKQREEMLIDASGGISDRGFIATLEKTIATQADCIVLLGKFSNFVRSSALLYFSLHPSNTCAVSICSENFHNVDKTQFSTKDIPNKYLI